MRFRAGPLRQAAILAAVFVLARVAYRIIFGGASGSGVVLVDLPRIPLGGAFSGITLLGPITTGGLANAVVSALPFAAIILAFGLLNAVVDMRRVFVHGSTHGPFRAVSRSLVIAWATAPALAASVRSVRRAAALRGERGAAPLLVPVFEQTIERALTLAASMEVRGFAASTRTDGVCERPVVADDVSLSRDDGWHVDHIDLILVPGTLSVVVGPTGSGKSSLLRSLTGLFQHFDGGVQSASLEVDGLDRANTPPRDTAGHIGFVAQGVRGSFAAETVHDEIGFALAVRGVAAAIVDDRVREIAARLGISTLLKRDVSALSAGQATLVAIAASVVANPILLVVDEPLAELDAIARQTVSAALDSLAHEAGVCVVVAEHRITELLPIADDWFELSGSALISIAAPGLESGGSGLVDRLETPATASLPLLEVTGLAATRGGENVLENIDLALGAGEIVALAGRNGAGKSSLLTAIALPDRADTVRVNDSDVHALAPRHRREAIALVPEAFDELFFTTSVAAECARADRRDHPAVATSETFCALLGREHGIEDLLVRHPRDLSAGERLCLAMAIQLAPAPAVLLIDEPARGLDARARALVGAAVLLAASRDHARAAVLFATHDTGFADQFATRRLLLEDGAITAVAAGVAS